MACGKGTEERIRERKKKKIYREYRKSNVQIFDMQQVNINMNF